MPEETHNMVMNYLNGNKEQSLEQQIKLLELIKQLFITTNPIPVKKALELMGKIDGTLRLPLTELPAEQTKQLIKEMKNNGIVI